MKTINLIQGSPEWHQHRATHFNASDAPAMLGVSPYKTRNDLLREMATGVTAEVDASTQRRFDDGHRFEALARPLAEKIIGEELFPCTGSEGKLSASFDGLTMGGSIGWEHKTLNDELRAAIDLGFQGDLPLHYRAQLEQQLIVSGAETILFMASKWDGDVLIEERHCWYRSDAELRDRILQGWCQFSDDVAAYIPDPQKADPVASVVEGFGALSLRVEGRVLASNLDAFRAGAEAFIARLPKPADLQTDQDFADADAAVKACAEAESRIKSAKEAALAQMADVDAVLRTADSISEAIRSARLALDKVVKAEKENRRADLIRAGVNAVREHYSAINATMAGFEIGVPASLTADIGSAIKGLKSLDSIRGKIDAAVANAKIAASQDADRRRQCIALLPDDRALFPDAATLVATKSPDDLRNLITARIAEHEAKEKARLESEREKIRAEEAARIEAERKAAEAKPACEPEPATVAPVSSPPAQKVAPAGLRTPVKTRPTDAEIIEVLSLHYRVHESKVVEWLLAMDLDAASRALVA